MKELVGKMQGDDTLCWDSIDGHFVGILRHSLGFYGESTGEFSGMKTTSLNEIGYLDKVVYLENIEDGSRNCPEKEEQNDNFIYHAILE